MDTKQFNPEDIAYTSTGRRVQVVAVKRNGYIVELGYHDEDTGDEWFEA